MCTGLSCKLGSGICLHVDRNAFLEDVDIHRQVGVEKENVVSFADGVSVLNNLGLVSSSIPGDNGMGISSSKGLQMTSWVNAGLDDKVGHLGFEALKASSMEPDVSGFYNQHLDAVNKPTIFAGVPIDHHSESLCKPTSNQPESGVKKKRPQRTINKSDKPILLTVGEDVGLNDIVLTNATTLIG